MLLVVSVLGECVISDSACFSVPLGKSGGWQVSSEVSNKDEAFTFVF